VRRRAPPLGGLRARLLYCNGPPRENRLHATQQLLPGAGVTENSWISRAGQKPENLISCRAPGDPPPHAFLRGKSFGRLEKNRGPPANNRPPCGQNPSQVEGFSPSDYRTQRNSCFERPTPLQFPPFFVHWSPEADRQTAKLGGTTSSGTRQGKVAPSFPPTGGGPRRPCLVSCKPRVFKPFLKPSTAGLFVGRRVE